MTSADDSIRDGLARVLGGGRLGREEAAAIFGASLEGGVDPALLGGLLVGLAQRGESPEEVAGAAVALRGSMRRFEHGEASAVDTCGTGGDGLGTFNVSTAAAFVAAGAGAKVVKHGNRSVSSRCGSADLLEALGGAVDVPDEVSLAALAECGFTFLFAPRFHPSMRHAAAARRALGIRTIFNLVGPLANPGGVRRQVIGVSTRGHVELLGRALAELETEAAYVVHGGGGADELTLEPENLVSRLGAAPAAALQARALGLAEAPATALAGGDASHNARLLRALLAGEPGPLRDATCLNAAAALLVAGVESDAAAALARAQESVDSGAAGRAAETWVRLTAAATAEVRS
ncbi:MAG: anthranilate phosphoribosyltransferase [Planctomycetota bacterium]|nr:anthranilate phosphoribosyltransferase [Planctomycetota bacterium]